MAITDFLGVFQLNNLLLFVLIVIILVIAFKLLKIFFETLLVAILSAVFYLFLSYSGANLDMNATNILFFSLIGTIVFIIYSMLSPLVSLLFKTGNKVVKGTSKALKGRKFKSRIKSKPKESAHPQEKEVILKEIKND